MPEPDPTEETIDLTDEDEFSDADDLPIALDD